MTSSLQFSLSIFRQVTLPDYIIRSCDPLHHCSNFHFYFSAGHMINDIIRSYDLPSFSGSEAVAHWPKIVGWILIPSDAYFHGLEPTTGTKSTFVFAPRLAFLHKRLSN